MKSKYIVQFIFIVIILNCNEIKKADDGSIAAAALILTSSTQSSSSPTNNSNIVTTTFNSGVYTTSVNAASSTEWIYLSLKNGGVKVDFSENWDLKFQRMNMGTFSGTSVTSGGSGGACTNGTTDFNITWTGNECIKTIDEKLISSGGGGTASFNASVNPILASPLDLSTRPATSPWYNYSSERILTSRNFVYIITGFDNSKYTLKITDYYSSAGTSGYPKFIWKKI